MGDNTSGQLLETLILDLSNEGLLNRRVLDLIRRNFSFTDWDEGGFGYDTDKNGKDVFRIVVDILDPDYDPSLPDEYGDECGYSGGFYDYFHEWPLPKLADSNHEQT